jgi:hypothetical protein
MESIVNALLKIFPFSKYFIEIGLSDDESAGLSFLILIFFLWLIALISKRLLKRYGDTHIAKNLRPQFDLKSIKEATTNYIPTHSQNASPTLEEEPGFSNKHVFRQKLIPFLLKDGFNEMRGANKFHIVLADSGMGKTTFMINLYMKYISFWNFRKRRDTKIKLYRLGYPETLDLVKKIDLDEAKNIILLLDALDEDPFIVSKDENIPNEEAFIRRVDDIIDVAKNFREVVFTCRTQYFPNQENNPYELKIKRPDEKGYYTLKKLYVSPFTDKEIKKYIRREYKFWKLWKGKEKKRAFQLIRNTPKLVVRPMLLKYINDLAQENRTYNTTYEVYETLIEKWYEREALKRKYHKEIPDFIKDLKTVSLEITDNMFNKHLKNQALAITEIEAKTITTRNNINLLPTEVTGQSLLTCDGYNNWKFAHKSIFEFFVYSLAQGEPNILLQLLLIKFSGLDMTKLFFNDNLIFLRNKTAAYCWIPDATNELSTYFNSINLSLEYGGKILGQEDLIIHTKSISKIVSKNIEFYNKNAENSLLKHIKTEDFRDIVINNLGDELKVGDSQEFLELSGNHENSNTFFKYVLRYSKPKKLFAINLISQKSKLNNRQRSVEFFGNTGSSGFIVRDNKILLELNIDTFSK